MFIPAARVILLAMREPSERMLSLYPTGPTGSYFPDDLRRAIIDAALEEG